jgi:hypothetical protein
MMGKMLNNEYCLVKHHRIVFRSNNISLQTYLKRYGVINMKAIIILLICKEYLCDRSRALYFCLDYLIAIPEAQATCCGVLSDNI